MHVSQQASSTARLSSASMQELVQHSPASRLQMKAYANSVISSGSVNCLTAVPASSRKGVGLSSRHLERFGHMMLHVFGLHA